jgi:hypothetical protein
MAKSAPRPGGRPQPARAAAKSKKPATSTVEVVEESPGIGPDVGLAIMTSVVLLAALVIVDMMQGKNGDGIFF